MLYVLLRMERRKPWRLTGSSSDVLQLPFNLQQRRIISDSTRRCCLFVGCYCCVLLST